MKLALHRSITFWSGILVVAFVCWAWWDSMHMASVWRLGRHGSLTEVGLNGAALYYGRMRIVPPNPAALLPSDPMDPVAVPSLPVTGPAGAVGRTTSGLDNDRWFPSLYAETDFMGYEDRIEHRLLIIPLWLILAVFVPSWLGLLLWRAKRRGRGKVLPA
jgi:hypothetical protein